MIILILESAHDQLTKRFLEKKLKIVKYVIRFGIIIIIIIFYNIISLNCQPSPSPNPWVETAHISDYNIINYEVY